MKTKGNKPDAVDFISVFKKFLPGAYSKLSSHILTQFAVFYITDLIHRDESYVMDENSHLSTLAPNEYVLLKYAIILSEAYANKQEDWRNEFDILYKREPLRQLTLQLALDACDNIFIN